jgi:hypothetical protein
VIPEPLFDETRRLGCPQKMAGLDWKSDAAATVIHPLLKGTGDPPERHRRGKISKTRIEISIRVFLLRTFVILSEAKNLGFFLPQRRNEQPEMF